MVAVDGWLSGYSPRISTKRPAGQKIAQKLEQGDSVRLRLGEWKNEDEETGELTQGILDEELLLECEFMYSESFQLDDLPQHLQKEIPRHANRVGFEVYEIQTKNDYEDNIMFETSEEPIIGLSDTEPGPTDTIGVNPPEKYSDIQHTSQEILESISADVLSSLGYETETNCYRENRNGSTSEVDVWAEKPEANFAVYVSCKNWDSRVGRDKVETEVGRIMNLKRVPQLRILVVGELTDSAAGALNSNGFLAITIDKKAGEGNVGEVYRTIHRQLREVSLTLAPPQVERVASQAEVLSEELETLSDNIRELGGHQ